MWDKDYYIIHDAVENKEIFPVKILSVRNQNNVVDAVADLRASGSGNITIYGPDKLRYELIDGEPVVQTTKPGEADAALNAVLDAQKAAIPAEGIRVLHDKQDVLDNCPFRDTAPADAEQPSDCCGLGRCQSWWCRLWSW